MEKTFTILPMLTVNHRGLIAPSTSLSLHSLECGPSSVLEWELPAEREALLWHLDFQFDRLDPLSLATCRHTLTYFLETIEAPLGVILYKGRIPPFSLEQFSEFLHLLAAPLPDEIPPFALFNCPGDPHLFSKEIFSHIHLGFRSGNYGALHFGETVTPLRHDGTTGVALPLREKGLRFSVVEKCLADLEKRGISYRLIAEPYITEEWDELEELIIFSDWISPWGKRMAKGFEAAGGKIKEISG